MDGNLAPLAALAKLAQRFDAWLLSDDAHGFGVVGGGRGSSFTNGAPVDVPLQMGTLSKAVGAYGGYLCASRAVIDFMQTRAHFHLFDRLAAPVIAAAIAGLEVSRAIRPMSASRCARPNSSRARSIARSAKRDRAGDRRRTEAALKASELLRDEGFLVVAIRPPTVPAGTARLRFAFTALHPDADIERLADVVRMRVLRR